MQYLAGQVDVLPVSEAFEPHFAVIDYPGTKCEGFCHLLGELYIWLLVASSISFRWASAYPLTADYSLSYLSFLFLGGIKPHFFDSFPRL